MNLISKDKMNIGDIVTWTTSKNHDYFNESFRRRGILLKKIEIYDYWVFGDVLNEQGKVDRAMLYKGDNPL